MKIHAKGSILGIQFDVEVKLEDNFPVGVDGTINGKPAMLVLEEQGKKAIHLHGLLLGHPLGLHVTEIKEEDDDN